RRPASAARTPVAAAMVVLPTPPLPVNRRTRIRELAYRRAPPFGYSDVLLTSARDSRPASRPRGRDAPNDKLRPPERAVLATLSWLVIQEPGECPEQWDRSGAGIGDRGQDYPCS